MIDYNDPNDPNYDPYWGDKETGHNGPPDGPDLSGFELDELEEKHVREMREEGLLRPTPIRPAESESVAEKESPLDQPAGEGPF